jgi:hypothetical protein
MTTKWNPSDAQGRQGIAITELFISKLGHQFREQVTNDAGIDAHVELVDQTTRKVTGQLVALQIKAGPSYFTETSKDAIIFRGELKHLDYWLNHSLSVFLVLVDTAEQKAFWQEITMATVERLEKGWKVAVPFTQDLNVNFVATARQRVGLDADAFSYTRLTLQDTSNGVAKRYAATLLMRSPITRLKAEAVIRKASADIRKERYWRGNQFKEKFRDHDADVVCLYVAGDLHDTENSNWYCRTMWVFKELQAGARPGRIDGVDLGDGLEVVWNTDYVNASQFYQDLQIGKQEFITGVKDFTTKSQTLIANAFGQGSQIICDPEVLALHAASMRGLFVKSSNIGLPPYECKDAAQRFEDVMVIADNAFMDAEKSLNEPENCAWAVLLERKLRDFRVNLDRLHYELEKII